MKLIEARKIWDAAPHNAFTDLRRFNDRWFCVFREGAGHVSPDGALRVITSPDGAAWESAARITAPDSDLRDPKLCVTPAGELMLCGAEKLHNPTTHVRQSLAWFSADGHTWSERYAIGDPDYWLWRVTWHGGKAYTMGYRCGAERIEDRQVRLYVSEDGRRFRILADRVFAEDFPNESALAYVGDTAWCLLRCDTGTQHARIGSAPPPYTRWEWRNLGVRIGGPNFLVLPDGRFLAAVRLWSQGAPCTVLCWLDPRAGKLTEALTLPSGGDTSYAGLAVHDGILWVSYYSAHEEKTSIYLAQVRLA